MKIAKYCFIPLFFIHLASCQQVEEKNYELRAKAVDEKGKPLNGIQVTTGKLEIIRGAPIPAAKPLITDPVLTDETGIAVLNFKSATGASGNVNFYQDGYYSTMEKVTWEYPDGFEGKSRKGEIQAVLKPVRNPIPMVVHSSTGFPLREIGVEYAFDLEIGELLPPHGNGKHPDILAKLEGERIDNGPDEGEDVDFRITIRFSNPLDGFFEFEVQPKDGARGSALVSDHLAPENGYQNLMERRSVLGKFLVPDQNWSYIASLEKKACYFRVRTQTDDSGKIISSNYGKIYGPIRLIAGKTRKVFHPTILEASCSMKEVYFNPIPNDRNVEFDPKRNILPGNNILRP